jgi:hypothetical protein
MSLIQKSRTFFFSSNENIGALSYKSDNGSRFRVKLANTIQLPPSAINVSIECTGANIWRTSPNISAEYENNIFYFTDGLIPRTIVIPDGAYGIDDLNATINRSLIPYNLDGEVTFLGDRATQRVYVKHPTTVVIDTASGPNNISDTLGLSPSAPIVTSAGTGYSFTTGIDAPKLNRINSYLIHCNDLVQHGISINNRSDGILTEVQLTALHGNEIAFRPYIPYVLDGNHLTQGNGVGELEFRLTDEQNREVDTFEDNWSLSIMIRYTIDTNHLMDKGHLPKTSHMSN